MQLPSWGVTRRGLLATGGAILAGGCVSAERTPEPGPHDWPLAGGDPGRTGFAPDTSPPRSEPDVAWERTPNPASGRSPIVGNGTLYYQTGDELYVLDPVSGNGSEVGTYGVFEGTGSPAFAPSETYRDGMYLVPYGGEVAGYPAAPSSWPESIPDDGRQRMRWSSAGDGPAVDRHPVRGAHRPGAQPIPVDGTVVFESGGRSAGRIVAVDVDDGTLRWERPVGQTLENVDSAARPSSTTVVDADYRLVITTIGDGFDFAGGLEARRLTDGSHEWSNELTNAGAALAASNGTVFLTVTPPEADSPRLTAHSVEDGSTRWSQPIPVADSHGIAVDDVHCYHTGRRRRGESDDDGPLSIVAVDRDDGTVAWEQAVGTASSFGFEAATQQPTVGGDVVLAPGGEAIHAFDGHTGQRLWEFTRTVPTSGGSRSPRRPMTPVIPVGERLVVAMTLALYGLEAP